MSKRLTALAAGAVIMIGAQSVAAQETACASALVSLKQQITEFGLATEKGSEIRPEPKPRDEVVKRREKRELMRFALANAARSYLRAHKLARQGKDVRCMELVEEGRSYLPS